jgi:hypothetical protein
MAFVAVEAKPLKGVETGREATGSRLGGVGKEAACMHSLLLGLLWTTRLHFTTEMLPRLLRPTTRQQRVLIHLRCLSTAPSPPQAFLSRSEDPKNSGISFLTLDRPAAKNSLSVQLLQDFRAALDEVRFDG